MFRPPQEPGGVAPYVRVRGAPEVDPFSGGAMMPGCESGPAALSARRHLGRRRRQLRPVLRARHQGRAVPVRRPGRHGGVARASRCPSRPTRSGTATCPTSCPGSSTATASTARTSRRRATASTRTRSSSIRTPRRSAATLRWDDALFGYKIGDASGPVVRRARQRRVRPAGGGDRHGLHLGRRPPAAHALAQDAHLRGARQGLHQAPSRGARERAAAPTPAWRPSRSIEHLTSLGVTAVELLPVHHHLDDRHLVEQGLTNYWGYNTLGFFAPDAALRRAASPISAVQRVQDDGPRPARGRHRGDPRRGLQPHRRGQPAGPDAVAARRSTTPATTACRPRTPATTWTSPAAATR